MKKVRYPNLDDYDLSCYEELKGDILYKINGGTTMSSADQQAMAEACKNGNTEKQAEIKAKYETNGSTSTGTNGLSKPTSTATSATPTQTDAPAQSTALDHGQQADMAKQDAERKTGGAGNGGSSYGSGYSGGKSTSTSGNDYPAASRNNGNCKTNVPSVQQKEHDLKVGLAHVEDYKRASRVADDKRIAENVISAKKPAGKEIHGWRNNGDGTHTVIGEGATLWGLYGANWKSVTGYDGDPTRLQVGDTVGKKMRIDLGTGDMTVTERIGPARKNGASENKFPDTTNGYIIDHKSKTIRASLSDKKALVDAADKFQTYETLGEGYKFEGCCADGSRVSFSKFSELINDMDSRRSDVEIFLGFDNSGDTFNQNKTEKELFFEVMDHHQSSKKVLNHVQSGVLHLSSELKNSPKTNHIAGSMTFDCFEGEYNMEIDKRGGIKISAGANVATLSGDFGVQGDDWKFAVGGSIGWGKSIGLDANWPEKRIAADLTAILGLSFVIDLPDNIVEWGK